MKPRRFPTLVAFLATAVLLGACAPFAQFARDLLDTSTSEAPEDRATLTYVLRTDDQLPGLLFDPGDVTTVGPALGVILIVTGRELTLLRAPLTGSCEATATVIDCRLGDTTELQLVNLTGLGVLASATYRRPESNRILTTYARTQPAE